jgi:hypothetical protein
MLHVASRPIVVISAGATSRKKAGSLFDVILIVSTVFKDAGWDEKYSNLIYLPVGIFVLCALWILASHSFAPQEIGRIGAGEISAEVNIEPCFCPIVFEVILPQTNIDRECGVIWHFGGLRVSFISGWYRCRFFR